MVRKLAHNLLINGQSPISIWLKVLDVLITAFERFDPTQDYAFSSFTVPYIRGEILYFFRERAKTVRVPYRWQQLSRKGVKLRQALVMELGRQPSDQEIVDALKLSMNEWPSIKLALLIEHLSI